ncbi:MAG: hypothetical protein J6A67_07095 [Clostridia bacterium]|nr:hypothetical protein [Clostridia bacterium]
MFLITAKKILSIILSFIFGFFTYPFSFIPSLNDANFELVGGDFTSESVILNGESQDMYFDTEVSFNENYLVLDSKKTINFEDITHGWYNYYGIAYSTDAYIKGTLTYRCGIVEKSENFFLEPGENKTFYSFIDNMLSGTKANAICSVSFEPLDKETAKIKINGISIYNREIPDEDIFIQTDTYKIGVNLLWGGALSYMEDLNSNVEAVEIDGRIFVDSNAGKRYDSEVINSNVNLINRADTGRLVQQSYYGSFSGQGYENGEYMGNVWDYNPVQGGNQFNENSKIVDVRYDDNSIYIKCQPLDWAKPKECITPSYMEANYVIEENLVRVSCRFVDFSGYVTNPRHQEIPAFYCIEPFNRFVYYGGNQPWTNDTISIEPDLIFWPDAGYPNFVSSENWAGFIGEFDDSFGIGVYVPGETTFLSGVFNRETTSNPDPSVDGTTSYIAVIRSMALQSYTPFEYSYYLTTGDTTEIRENFKTIV